MLTMTLGFIGSLISFILWIPQPRMVWLVRKDPHALRGISMTTQFLVMINATVWFIYAGVLGEFWVGAAGIVNFPLAVLTVTLLVKARRNSPEETYCLACGYHSREPHVFFVTAPPGWGTVYDCTQKQGAQLPRGIGVLRENVPALRASLESSRGVR